jgi:hypothetical protein
VGGVVDQLSLHGERGFEPGEHAVDGVGELT